MMTLIMHHIVEILRTAATKPGDVPGQWPVASVPNPPKWTPKSLYWTSSHCSSFNPPPKDLTIPSFSNFFMCNWIPLVAASINESG
jgi:hypothetical protein